MRLVFAPPSHRTLVEKGALSSFVVSLSLSLHHRRWVDNASSSSADHHLSRLSPSDPTYRPSPAGASDSAAAVAEMTSDFSEILSFESAVSPAATLERKGRS